MAEFVVDPQDDSRELSFHPANAATARTLTAEQIQQFNEDGYLSALPVFPSSDAVRIRNYIDSLLDAVVAAPDPRNTYSVISYHIVCEGLYDIVKTPALHDIVSDLLGPDFVCWGTHLFSKPPHDPKAVPLHQDATYWPLTPSKSVTVWLAIDDVDEQNAAMEFVPGSHRAGPLPHEAKPLDGSRVLNRQVCDPGSYQPRRWNRLRAGEVSVHSDLLLHGSPPNKSDRRRAGLTIRYAAADVGVLPGEEYFLTPAVHCRGEIPEHWPDRARPHGENPNAMANVWGDFDGTPPGS